MARKRKLNSAQIREIFRSREPAKALSQQFGVSQQMIYLIRSGRYYADITGGPKRARKASRSALLSAQPSVDVNALADAVIDRLIKRLRTDLSPLACGDSNAP
jgi:hypothetical protein